MSAPGRPLRDRAQKPSHTKWTDWAWFGGAILLFLTYLFGGAWLTGRSAMLQSFDEWLRHWQDVIWVGGVVLAGIGALARSISGEEDH